MATQIFLLHFVQLPQLYALEAQSDSKDMNRIKTAFSSMVRELGVVNYDNAVWDATHEYINDRNPNYIRDNFVLDAFKSIGLNGLHIYDLTYEKVWGSSFSNENWEPISFLPFDQPSDFVIENVLKPSKKFVPNTNKPISYTGLISLNGKLILFSATSVMKANLQSEPNGIMVFWRVLSDEVLLDLQSRSGINFKVEQVAAAHKFERALSSRHSYKQNSYRTESGIIFDFIPFASGGDGIKYSYVAPLRLFETSWFNQGVIFTSLLFSVTLLIVLIFVHVVIVHPLIKARELVNAVVLKRDLSVRFNSKRQDELGVLFNLIDRLLADVSSKEQELISHNLRLQHISRTDGLTNIANRRAFDMYMQKLLSSSQNREVSLLVCDVDYFKNYNDFYGHDKGDKALCLIAECLKKNLHEETDFVARYGGEEFVVVLKDTNLNQAESVAVNLISSVSMLNIQHEKSEVADFVTVSIGIHTFNSAVENDTTWLFECADKALYLAKTKGRNRFCSHNHTN